MTAVSAMPMIVHALPLALTSHHCQHRQQHLLSSLHQVCHQWDRCFTAVCTCDQSAHVLVIVFSAAPELKLWCAANAGSGATYDKEVSHLHDAGRTD